MSSKAFIFVKPEAYKKLDESAQENCIKTNQQTLPNIKDFVDVGEEQLKAKTGYTDDNLPEESPTRTTFKLDEINFKLVTNVKKKAKYQSGFDKITGFLEVLINDWKQNIRKDKVRTYYKEPFIDWHYLMYNVLWYLSKTIELGVENKFEKITAPSDLEKMKLERLVIAEDLIKDFSVDKEGAAKTWYLANRFYNEVMEETIKPTKKEVEKRSRITVEKLPEKTVTYLEQFGKYIASLQSIPSPQRQPAKAINRLYLIPQKRKPEGSKELPVIPNPNKDSPSYYINILEAYKDILSASLKKWENLEGNIGELITFYYSIENHPRLQEEFPFLPEYNLQRDGDKMFISTQALYDRMKALEKDYIANRLLRKHIIETIV